MKDDDLPPLWMAVGIRLSVGELIVLQLSPDRGKAEEVAREQAIALPLEGASPWTIVGLHWPVATIWNKVLCWLADNGVVGAEAQEAARSVWRKVDEGLSGLECGK